MHGILLEKFLRSVKFSNFRIVLLCVLLQLLLGVCFCFVFLLEPFSNSGLTSSMKPSEMV